MKRTRLYLLVMALVLIMLPLFGSCGPKVLYPPINDNDAPPTTP
jgi:hypothetical protein